MSMMNLTYSLAVGRNAIKWRSMVAARRFSGSAPSTNGSAIINKPTGTSDSISSRAAILEAKQRQPPPHRAPNPQAKIFFLFMGIGGAVATISTVLHFEFSTRMPPPSSPTIITPVKNIDAAAETSSVSSQQ